MCNKLIKTTLATSIAALFACGIVNANPTNPAVVQGNPVFNTEGNQLFIGNAAGSIINWESFSIGANESTTFSLGSPSAAVLNRVTGTNTSEILGNLISDGKVFLINPNGIVFGNGSLVNVGSLIASTLDITDENFRNNNLIFEGNSYTLGRGSTLSPTSGIIQEPGSTIVVRREDGLVALVSNFVLQQGAISALQQNETNTRDNSVVTIATGTRVVLTDPKQPEVVFDLGNLEVNPEELTSFKSAFLTGLVSANTVTAVSGNGMVIAPGAITANSIETGDGGVVTLHAATNLTTGRSEQGPNTLFTDDITLLERHQRFIDVSGNNGGQVRIHAGGTVDLSTSLGSLSDDAVTAVLVSAQATQADGRGGNINVSAQKIFNTVLDARGSAGSGLVKLDSSAVSGSAVFENNDLLAESIEIQGGAGGLEIANNRAFANTAQINFTGNTVFSDSIQTLDPATTNRLDRRFFEPSFSLADVGAVGGIRVLNLNVQNGSLNFVENQSDQDLIPGFGLGPSAQSPSAFNAKVDGEIFSRFLAQEVEPDFFQTVSTGEVDFQNFEQIKLHSTAGNINISSLDLQSFENPNSLLLKSAGSIRIGNLNVVSESSSNNLNTESEGSTDIFRLNMQAQGDNNLVLSSKGELLFNEFSVMSFNELGANRLAFYGADLNMRPNRQSIANTYDELFSPRRFTVAGADSLISSDRRKLNIEFGEYTSIGNMKLDGTTLNLLYSSFGSLGSTDLKNNAAIRSTASSLFSPNIQSSDSTGSLIVGARSAQQLQELADLKQYELELFGNDPEAGSFIAQFESLGNTSQASIVDQTNLASTVDFEANTALLILGFNSNQSFDEVTGEPLPGAPRTVEVGAHFKLEAQNTALYVLNTDPSLNLSFANARFAIGNGSLHFVNGVYDIAQIGQFNRSLIGNGTVNFGSSPASFTLIESLFPGGGATLQRSANTKTLILRNSLSTPYDIGAAGGIGSFNLFDAVLEGGNYTSSNGTHIIGLSNVLLGGTRFGENIVLASLGGTVNQLMGNLALESGSSLQGSFTTAGDTFIQSINGATLQNDESESNTLLIGAGSTLTLGEGITVAATSNKSYVVDASQGRLINQGTLASNGIGANLVLRLNPEDALGFQNESNATIAVNQGSLSVENGPLNISSGTLKGVGTINANVELGSATLAAGLSPGTLIINGNLDMTVNTVTQVEILGPEQGSSTGYDFIQVNGTANLAGTLTSSTVNYTPPANQTFNFLQAESVNGMFSNFSNAGYTVDYTPTQASLVAVASPVDPTPPMEPRPPVIDNMFVPLPETSLIPQELVRSTVNRDNNAPLNPTQQSPAAMEAPVTDSSESQTSDNTEEDILLAKQKSKTSFRIAQQVNENIFSFQNEYTQLQTGDGKTCVVQ